MGSSKKERKTSSFSCVTRSVDLLKPNIANILLFNFCEQKFVRQGPITIAIDCTGLFLLILEEKWPNYASGPKCALNSDSFWVRRLFNVCGLSVAQMRQFAFSVSRSQVHLAKRYSSVYTIFVRRMDKTNYLSNFTWAKCYHSRNNHWFLVYACEFCVPQMRQFCLFTCPPRSKWASSEKIICFLPKSASSVSRSVAIFPTVVQAYTTIFVRRKDKTNYLSIQTWVKCYHSWNKH